MKRLPSLAVLSLCVSAHAVMPVSTPTTDGAARSNNIFCFSLWEQSGKAEGNDVFSPFSIWSALAMTSAGAQDETLQQMQKVLHLPAKDAHQLVSAWSASLKAVKGVQMKVANRLWGRMGLAFRPEFLKLCETQYDASLQPLDFASNPDAARKEINQWVSDRTEAKIKDLLAPNTINGGTRLVLTNAIYFNGQWQSPFSANNTHKKEFTLSSGKKVEPETMSDTFYDTAYMENERLQAVKLNYQGAQTAMLIVLPKSVDALTKQSFLAAQDFGPLASSLKPEKRVVVQLPRFEASGKLELSKELKSLGMPRDFEDNAQFGVMCGDPLKISQVIYQAWIKVGEKGTEAAAATAVVALPAGMANPTKQEPPKYFVADHPFLFFVIDTRNNGILFAGRMMDPMR